MMPPNIKLDRKVRSASRIMYPRPLDAATISAATATTNAKPAEIRMPTMIFGSAAGNMTFTK